MALENIYADPEWAAGWEQAQESIRPDPYTGDQLPPGWRKSYEDQMRGQTLINRLRGQISDLQELRRQFSGTEGTWMRWLISTEMHNLNSRIDGLHGIAPSKRGEAVAEPVIPDWMQAYLEKSIPAEVTRETVGMEQARPRRWGRPEPEPARALRPIGAQAELTPDQMGVLAGYQSWGAAGSPRRYSEEAITEMSDWQKRWAQQVRLSESLFPTQTRLRGGWRTALQR